MINTYKELTVWQKSIELVVAVYALCKAFPKEEVFGLSSQLKRASVSIPSNIAEGWVRKNTKEFKNFLSISSGSAGEVETQLIISEKLQFGDTIRRNKCFGLLVEIQKMLAVMSRNLPRS